MTSTTVDLPGYVVGTWDVDDTHSDVGFVVRHLVVTKVRGKFADVKGTIVTAENPLDSSVDITIGLNSISTHNETRDNHLRSADFFDAAGHPAITFRSTRVVADGRELQVHGDLTIRGVTKEIVLPVAHMGKAKDPWGGDRLGFEVETSLNRKDYGLSFNIPLAETGGFLVGDEVKVTIEIQAVGQ